MAWRDFSPIHTANQLDSSNNQVNKPCVMVGSMKVESNKIDFYFLNSEIFYMKI